MELLRCALYLAVSGLILFFAGRAAPKHWFCPDRLPFRSLPFEREGRFYERFGIRRWQDKLPDMSFFLPALVPRKRLEGRADPRLERMIQETCVAELTHVLLCLTGLHCMDLWPGAGGKWVAALNVAGNALFIMIQRYNRPRLIRLLTRTRRNHRKEETIYACADSKL